MCPELTKLEVIDGGSADTVFLEVNFPDGSEVMSFTAGTLYVVKNVADPKNAIESYTTQVTLRGLFTDGTEVILLRTILTFTAVIPFSPIKEYFHENENFIMKNADGSINISMVDLFFKGLSQTVNECFAGKGH